MQQCIPSKSTGRRGFFKIGAAIFAGTLSLLAPVGAALTVIFDPLHRREAGSGKLIKVASLDALPADGVPRKFNVLAEKIDAWVRTPHVPIGAVYLRRTGEKSIEAFNAICPHAGGFIDYLPSQNCFFCPLHNSQFTLDGAIAKPSSPSPRAMDALPVEIRGGEIWVAFQDFQAGAREKIPA